MGPGRAVAICLSKYFQFQGRASRPEFWWFSLFAVVLSWAAMLVDRSGTLSAVINLALMIPSMAAATRRLHDTGRSGWWQLLMLTIIGLIPLVIWWCSKGDAGANAYGDPA